MLKNKKSIYKTISGILQILFKLMTERNEIMKYDTINTFWFHGRSWDKYAVNSLWGFELLQKALQILKFWKVAVIQPLKEKMVFLYNNHEIQRGKWIFKKVKIAIAILTFLHPSHKHTFNTLEMVLVRWYTFQVWLGSHFRLSSPLLCYSLNH